MLKTENWLFISAKKLASRTHDSYFPISLCRHPQKRSSTGAAVQQRGRCQSVLRHQCDGGAQNPLAPICTIGKMTGAGVESTVEATVVGAVVQSASTERKNIKPPPQPAVHHSWTTRHALLHEPVREGAASCRSPPRSTYPCHYNSTLTPAALMAPQVHANRAWSPASTHCASTMMRPSTLPLLDPPPPSPHALPAQREGTVAIAVRYTPRPNLCPRSATASHLQRTHQASCFHHQNDTRGAPPKLWLRPYAGTTGRARGHDWARARARLGARAGTTGRARGHDWARARARLRARAGTTARARGHDCARARAGKPGMRPPVDWARRHRMGAPARPRCVQRRR